MKIADIDVIRDRNEICHGDELTRISPLAMDVLCALAEHNFEVVSRETLLQRFWHQETATENAIYKVISELRHAVGDQTRDIPLIKTVPKRGYCLNAEVTLSDSATVRYTGQPKDMISESIVRAEQALVNRMYQWTMKYLRVASDLIAQQVTPEHRLELKVALMMGQATLGIDGRDAARKHFERAATIAGQLQDHLGYSRAILGMSGGMPPLIAAMDREMQRALQSALQGLGPGHDEIAIRLRARLLYYTSDRDGPQIDTAQALVADARRFNDADLLAEALVAWHAMLTAPQYLSRRLTVSSELLELAPDLRDRDMVASTFLRAASDALAAGDRQRFDKIVELFSKQQPAIVFADDLARIYSNQALMAGKPDAAEVFAMSVSTRETGPELIQMLQLYNVFRQRNQQREIMPLMEALTTDRADIPVVKIYMALTYAESGQSEQFDAFVQAHQIKQMSLPGDVSDTLVLAGLIDVCIVAKDTDWAQRLLSLVLPFSGQHLTQGAICYLGAGDFFIGRLQCLLGQLNEGAASLLNAARDHDAVGASAFKAATEALLAEPR